MRTLNVAFGYEFEGEESPRILQAIQEVCEEANAQLQSENVHVKVRLKSECEDYGRLLNEQIRELFVGAQIGMFEITESNPNVMYEAGLYSAHGASPIYVRRLGSPPVPADIQGLLTLPYESPDDQEFRNRVLKVIVDCARTLIVPRPEDPVDALVQPSKQFWFGEASVPDDIIVVTGRIPVEVRRLLEESNHPDLDSAYLEFTDKETLIEVSKVLALLYPRSRQTRCTGSDYMEHVGQLGHAIVSIGGPDFNDLYRWVVGKIQLPFRFVAHGDGDSILLDQRDGHEYRAKRKDRHPVHDYGLLVRLKSTAFLTGPLLILAGITTLGVRAAASMLDPQGHVAQLIEEMNEAMPQDRSFAVVVSAEQVGRSILDCSILPDTLIPLLEN